MDTFFIRLQYLSITLHLLSNKIWERWIEILFIPPFILITHIYSSMIYWLIVREKERTRLSVPLIHIICLLDSVFVWFFLFDWSVRPQQRPPHGLPPPGPPPRLHQWVAGMMEMGGRGRGDERRWWGERRGGDERRGWEDVRKYISWEYYRVVHDLVQKKVECFPWIIQKISE